MIEDDLVVPELVISILENEEYAVIASETPVAARSILEHVQFDLVITAGFNRDSTALLVNSIEALRAAGATPIALFSVQQVKLEASRALGFRDVLAKPFELEVFVSQVRGLLQR